MKITKFLSGLIAAVLAAGMASSAFAQDKFTTVVRPDTTGTNRFYVGNRQPLAPANFLPLPVGSVEPKSWVRVFLERQREGLTGHLGEISAWLQKADNAWLSKDGKGKYGWEELPYWLKGYIELGYIFNDAKMIAECRTWVEGTLASQRPNGDFGPDQRLNDGNRDHWANMIMLFCLQSYYEQAQDQRVLDLMSRYFQYQMTVPDEQLLTGYWQRMRGGDNLHSIYWLYNRTGDPQLLEVAKKIHRRTANWKMKNDLPNWHNVNIAQCFREPATFYQQSHDLTDLQAAYDNFRIVRERYGQVPGGMFGSDEVCRPGYDDPRQATETCGFVEQMLSDAMLMQISGDPFWADHCEEVAFNSYPAAVMPDFRALRYLTAPNMVLNDRHNHAPGIANAGPFLMMNPFSSRCCQHNHSHGWPYFNKHLWMATPDNGLCAALYSACVVQAKAGNGTAVHLNVETKYPFEEQVRITVASEQAARFPLYLRIPAWCDSAAISLNGKRVALKAAPGKYARLEREWKKGDVVVLELPMQVSLRRWARNHNSVSVDYGPLTFSLKIGERYDRFDSAKTAIGDSQWQATADPSKWPSFEIHPATPWNYGLVLDAKRPERSFSVRKLNWPANDFPFTVDSAPIQMQVKARKIPAWTLDRHGLCAPLQDSPAFSSEPVETVTLVPMGAARLRIASFPTVDTKASAVKWEAPPRPAPPLYKTTASHIHDAIESLCDRVVPKHSNDQDIPRFTFWDHRGTKEWVQYDFAQPRDVSSASVYWFDDTGEGQCRIPESWTLSYLAGDKWLPVRTSAPYAVRRDQWNKASFEPIKTKALRLEVQLQKNFSGGILEWQIQP